MKTPRLLLAALLLGAANPSAWAQAPEKSFEEELAPILAQATPPLQKDRIRSIHSVDSTDKAGIYVPSLGPSIINHPAYITGKEYPPQLEVLEPAIKDPLKVEWSGIESEKSGLTSESGKIDSDDTTLGQEASVLNRDRATLEQKKQTLSQDIDRYNAECTGRPLPPDEYNACQARRSALLTRIDQLNKEIDAFNVRVEAWNGKLATLKSRSRTLDGNISRWADRINQFVKTAEDALRNAQITRVRVQAQGGGLEASVTLNVPRPVTLREGFTMLDQLWAQLTPTQRDQRKDAFDQARAFMRQTAAVGGVLAPPPVTRSFSNPNPNPPDARVDVEIFRGRAFVDGIGKVSP